MSMETPSDIRRHELLADVAEQAAQRLMQHHKLDNDLACDVGNDLADFLAHHWRGQNIYFVGDQGFKLNQRDLEIFEKMRRGNAHDLAKEYGLSFVRIYQIYKRCLKEARARVQSGLFEGSDGAGTAELSTDDRA